MARIRATSFPSGLRKLPTFSQGSGVKMVGREWLEQWDCGRSAFAIAAALGARAKNLGIELQSPLNRSL